MSNTVYPYRVFYPRSGNWWDGDWRDLSEWCDECIGAGEWNYYGDTFVFCEEKSKILFELRWL